MATVERWEGRTNLTIRESGDLLLMLGNVHCERVRTLGRRQ